MNLRTKLFLGTFTFSAAVFGIGALHQSENSDATLSSLNTSDQLSDESLINPAAEPLDPAANQAGVPAEAAHRTVNGKIEAGSNVSQALRNLGISQALVAQLISAAKPIHNLAQIPANTEVTAGFANAETDDPTHLSFKLNKTQTLVLTRETPEADWLAKLHEAEVEKRLASYSGVVTTSLWDSAVLAGMDPHNINKLAEVFAWQIDFNREVQLDDRWRLSIEQLYVDGSPIGFGDILAAEYENAGVVSTAVRFEVPDSSVQYYAPDGNSLRRMFLKSPLKYGRITSGFTARRFHPVLGVYRAHRGIDYGAPTGTPIMAVGDGVIKEARYNGGSGNMVTIRHNAVYSTNYKHLSKYAPGIKPGAKVSMGQVIGYVGATGLATGPHLHYEFWENGRFVDPQSVRFPSADPIPDSHKESYAHVVRKALAELPPWSQIVISQAQKPRNEGLKASSILLPDAHAAQTE